MHNLDENDCFQQKGVKSFSQDFCFFFKVSIIFFWLFVYKQDSVVLITSPKLKAGTIEIPFPAAYLEPPYFESFVTYFGSVAYESHN